MAEINLPEWKLAKRTSVHCAEVHFASLISGGFPKGLLISEANCQVMNSSKKRTNEFVFATMRRVFIRFLEEIEDTTKTFRNYRTFTMTVINPPERKLAKLTSVHCVKVGQNFAIHLFY